MSEEEPLKKEDLLSWAIGYSSLPIVIIAGRGGGKSNAIGALAYALFKRGWLVIILDPKGAFTYFCLPNIADPEVATKVSEYWGKVEPPVDRMEFYMPYFAWDFENAQIPDYIEPAPISFSMIRNSRAWELFGGSEIKPKDTDNLETAYIFTGKNNTTVDSMISWLSKEGKLSSRIAELLCSGIVSTSSPIDPKVLLKKGGNRIIVLTNPVTYRPGIKSFWYGVFLESLFATLQSWKETLNVAIFIDETLVLSHGTMQTSSTWWFTLVLEVLLSQGRQVGGMGDVRSRLVLSSQLSTGIHWELLKLSGLAFVSPQILMSDSDKRYLRENFSRKIEPPKGIVQSPPGTFYIFTKDKKIGLYRFPVSPLFIPREYDLESEEDLKALNRQRKFIERHVNFKFLTPLFSEALTKQKEVLAIQQEVPPPLVVNWESRSIGITPLLTLWTLARMVATNELDENSTVDTYYLANRCLSYLQPNAPPKEFILNKISPIMLSRSTKKLLSFGVVVKGKEVSVTREFINRFAKQIIGDLPSDKLKAILLKRSRSRKLTPFKSSFRKILSEEEAFELA